MWHRRKSFPGRSRFTLIRHAIAIAAVFLAAACGKDNTGPDTNDGGGSIPPTQATETKVVIRNHSMHTLMEVRYSSCSALTYGDDIQTGATGPNESFSFEVSPGCYDVKVVDSDGTFAEFLGNDVSEGTSFVITITNG